MMLLTQRHHRRPSCFPFQQGEWITLSMYVPDFDEVMANNRIISISLEILSPKENLQYWVGGGGDSNITIVLYLEHLKVATP